MIYLFSKLIDIETIRQTLKKKLIGKKLLNAFESPITIITVLYSLECCSVRSGILQYTTNKQRKLAALSSSGQAGGGAGTASAQFTGTGGGGSNSTGTTGTGAVGGGGSSDGQGGILSSGGGDLSSSSASNSSGGSVASHRLSGGLEYRGSNSNNGGGGGGLAGGIGGLTGILSHSNNHLFHAMTGGGGHIGPSANSSGDVQATPPLQRRLAKSFSVAQSSSLQKGYYELLLLLILL